MEIFGNPPSGLLEELKTPCYIIDEGALRRNGEILKRVSQETGCRILLAQKAFSNYDLYPLLSEYLDGTEASGLYEARLGKEEMPGKEVHVFCAAYREDEWEELLRYADHIIFNSIRQLERFGRSAKNAGKSIGLRINPECSTQEGHEIYDPCARGSRLGVTRKSWDGQMTPKLQEMLDGIHFHTLCEQNSDDLETTLRAVEEKFGDILKLDNIKWLNMGGGHHITRQDYDIGLLERCIEEAQKKWKVQVYLEPGEACALNAGYLVSRVLDVTGGAYLAPIPDEKGREACLEHCAILDASAACHMPDVIEMPYVPPLYRARKVEESCGRNGEGYFYRLGGPTCLSGDVIGDYGFDHALKEGELLLFGDMAIYTMCKNNTFNGMPLPAIYLFTQNGTLEKLAEFGYHDFKYRLGGNGNK